jgi:hypothetical protein
MVSKTIDEVLSPVFHTILSLIFLFVPTKRNKKLVQIQGVQPPPPKPSSQ